MDNLIFVEDKKVEKEIRPLIPDDFKIIVISDIVIKKNDYMKQVIPDGDLKIFKELVAESESIHIIFTENFFMLEDFYAWIFDKLEIQNFSKVTFDNLEKRNIQNSFDSAVDVEKDEINYIVSRNKIDKIISVEITKVIKWFLLKEDFIDEEEASELLLTRSFLYALVVLVNNQDKIDNFVPEYYDKIAIQYHYNGIQFRVKSGKKFKADKEEELIALFNILSAKSNTHTIKKFERAVKDIPTVHPLTKHSLQKSCSYVFGYSPKETLKIAKELFDGIKIEDDIVSLITPVNTKSTRIDAERKLQIANFIENEFGKEFYFNGTRERKKSDDFETREAIVPRQINDLSTPEKVKKYLTEDQHRIYNYIFWRTISSEMINAEKDATQLVVDVEGETLKAESNKILQEGWLIAGGNWEHDIQLVEEEIELPLDLHTGMVLTEYKNDVSIYKVLERTPMRFSAGRFFDKASKDLLSDEQEATALIDLLIEYKLIILEVKSMIKPTQRAVRLFFTLKEYAPQLVDEAFISETFQALKNIKDGKLEKEVLIEGYYKQLAILRESLGYTQNDDNPPDDWKVNEAKKIAKQKNQTLSPEVLANRALLDNYLKNNEDAVEKLGVCPSCKRGEIFEQNKAYACNNSSCEFILWKNNITRFYKNFGKQFENDTITEQLKLILSKGKVLIDNMFYKEKFFDKYIVVAFSEKYKNWGFTFENRKKSVEIDTYKEVESNIPNEESSESVESNNIPNEEPNNIPNEESSESVESNIPSVEPSESVIEEAIKSFNMLLFIKYNGSDKSVSLKFLKSIVEKYYLVETTKGMCIYYSVQSKIESRLLKRKIQKKYSEYEVYIYEKSEEEFNTLWR